MSAATREQRAADIRADALRRHEIVTKRRKRLRFAVGLAVAPLAVTYALCRLGWEIHKDIAGDR